MGSDEIEAPNLFAFGDGADWLRRPSLPGEEAIAVEQCRDRISGETKKFPVSLRVANGQQTLCYPWSRDELPHQM